MSINEIPNQISGANMQQSQAATSINNGKVVTLNPNRRLGTESGSTMQITALEKNLFADAQGRVHEEQLQYAVVAYLLEQGNPAAAQQFHAVFAQLIGSGHPPLSFEDSTRLTLLELTKNGVLQRPVAEDIFGKSFVAAQLDPNQSELWDNRGGPGDITIAVKPIEEAVQTVSSALSAIERGELNVPPRSLDLAPNNHPGFQTASAGAPQNTSGFLWKPVSDSDGRLVVLLPSAYRGQIESVGIYSKLPADPSNLLEVGTFRGDWANGGRSHFRFNNPGGKYPDNSVVVAQLRDGRQIEFPIGDTARRFES